MGNVSTSLLTESPFTMHPFMNYSLCINCVQSWRYTCIALACKMPKAHLVESPADKCHSKFSVFF